MFASLDASLGGVSPLRCYDLSTKSFVISSALCFVVDKAFRLGLA